MQDTTLRPEKWQEAEVLKEYSDLLTSESTSPYRAAKRKRNVLIS
jgi:hypothetical protein